MQGFRSLGVVAVFTATACGHAAAPVAPTPAAPAAPAPPQPVVTADATPTTRTPDELARDAALLPRATAVLGAFSNSNGLVTRAGEVVFLSNRDGVSQLYVGAIAHPDAPARRLPIANERVTTATLTADEHAILFTSDINANGFFHIFRIGIDGTGLVDLTPGEPLHRDPPVIARKRPGRFAYSAHPYDSEATTVYVQDPDGPARKIYTDPRGGNLVDLAPDGTRALFARGNSAQDTVIFELDLGSGVATRVYPPEDHPANVSAGYTANADRILLASQLANQSSELIAVDAKTHKRVARYEEKLLPTGMIAEWLPSPTGSWLAIGIDGGDRTAIRVLDARTLALRRTIELPLGFASLGMATASGDRFTISDSYPAQPPDIASVDARTGAVTRLRADTRAGLAELPGIDASSVRVASFDALEIPTNLYLPAKATGKLPVLISIHGGPAASSMLRWSAQRRFYAAMGYAIVEPNIRGSTGFGVAYEQADDREKRADALRDVEAINRWARAQPWCDPDRVVIMGGSYGGYMTLLAVARQPMLWRAGLDVSGMSDLRTMERLEDQSIRVYDETEFGILGKQDDLLWDWSPLKHVDDIIAPVFVYQGAADPITPQNEADQIVAALRRRHVPVEYMLLANEGHGLSRLPNLAEYLARTTRFLAEHAGGP